MERNLVTTTDRADWLLDLSNIVRDRSLGGTGERELVRLRAVVVALAQRTRDPDTGVYVVADQSLLGGARGFRDQADVRTLRRWQQQGLIEVVPDADERLLELAEMTGLPVVSGDRFGGHRDTYPWLQGNTWQFFKPSAGSNGRVQVAPQDLGRFSPDEVSRRAELDTLKKQGLLGPSRVPLADVVGRSWRCPDRRCGLYDPSRGERVLLPRMRQGRPSCELHGLELVDAGPRAVAAQVKLLVSGSCVARYTLVDGTDTPIGRSPGEAGISLARHLPADTVMDVSRCHVVVSLRGGIVTVRDTSSNGTRMRSGDRHGRLGRPFSLTSGTEQRFRPGDEIELADSVTLTRSGRRFPSELPALWRQDDGSGPPPEDAAPTRFRHT
ncbi:FHA domain-containing protein [Actinacidiphila glaucinigra]|uniref:FHA domain-containing protein n=1 Tax=Actinacidiphila glaucinigra TaxID=235986 RepID=UPI002E3628B4|nr:FHA domain-containing protein [Actinacidiphila glaucinigra]